MMLLLPPASGKRTANLGPIEDFAFLATVATMWTLWGARQSGAHIDTPRAPARRAVLFRPNGRRARRPAKRVRPVRALAACPRLGSRLGRCIPGRVLMRGLRSFRSSVAPALMESVLSDPLSAVTPLQINALWPSDTIDPQIDLQQDR